MPDYKAILESPWLDPSIFRDLKEETPNGPSVESEGEEAASKLFDDVDGSLAKLRTLSAEEVLEKVKQRWPVTTDGWIFPRAPREIYADGDQHHIPTIVGTNRDEGTMFAPRNAFDSRLAAFSGMTLKQRVDLPNVPLWTFGAIVFFGLGIIRSYLLPNKKVEVSGIREILRFDLVRICVGLVFCYVLSMALGFLSFVWATLIFVPICGVILTGINKTRFSYVLEVSLLMSFGVHFVFTQIFMISLP